MVIPYGVLLSRVSGSNPDTSQVASVAEVVSMSHVVPSLKVTEVLSVIWSRPSPVMVRMSPPS